MMNQAMSVSTTFTGSVGGVVPALGGVPSAFAGAEAVACELGQAVASLVERLDQAGVLKVVPPRATTASTQPLPPNFNCSLANGIDNQRQRLQAIVGAIQELNERIDL